MRPLALVLAAVLAVPAFVACSAGEGEDATIEEANLDARHVKTLAKDRPYPGDMIVAGSKVYWSESRQVASGDPDLDQQFAYWTGTLYSYDVGRSRTPKELNQLGSPLRGAVQVGSAIYLTTASGVAKTTAEDLDLGKAWKEIYSDHNHFEVDEEIDVAASSIDGGRAYVLRDSGDVVSVKLDGSDFQKHLVSEQYASNLVVKDGRALWVTNSANPNERVLWRANLTAQRPRATEVARAREFSRLVLDGDDVLYGVRSGFGQTNTGAVYRVKAAAGAPEVIVPGLDEVYGITPDTDRLFLGVKRGTVEAVYTVGRASLGANAQLKKVHDVKVARDIVVTNDAVFVASSALDGRNRYAGSVLRFEKSAIR
jgi:hypothetical protein